MGKIQRMSPQLANMIAAGEVVERPQSVVKELVENAIDAHAKWIRVYLANGGLDEIKVVDDGDGMDSDDVVNAFLPHATSKIKTEYDLFRIATLGFRGEAISSIASVSQMQIISSTNGTEGYECTYKNGIKASCGIAHSNKGTTITVKNLFFNVPARLKHMKQAKNELSAITFFMDRIAMAHPDIKFSVIHDGKTIMQTTASADKKSLIAEIYGFEAAKNIMEREYVADGYKARLVFIKPQIYRSNKLDITMICNGRYVKSYNITNAVIEGFETYLPINKYPIGIMYFEIDPLLIDVNVHPAKTEIKISEEEAMSRKLTAEIKEMLALENHIPDRIIPEIKNEAYAKESIFNLPQAEAISVEYKSPLEFAEANPKYEEEINSSLQSIPPMKEEIRSEAKIPYMEYVGSVFGTYLIFQNSDGMYLMDQHAAAERINYEKYYKILGDSKQPVSGLIVPIMLEFTKDEANYVLDSLDEFKKLGFELDQAGERLFALREIPLWAKIDRAEDLVREIIDLMLQKHKIDIIYFRDEIAKSIACKASIKANHSISRVEIDSLMLQLNLCQNPYTCPHGRPTIIKLTVTDIEKMFERIQK